MALMKCKECGADVSTKANACPKCGAPAPKPRSIGPLILAAFAILLVMKLAWPDKASEPLAPAAVAALKASAAAPALETAASACRATIDAKKSEYVRLLDAKKYWEAGSALGDCPERMKDQALIDMQNGARRLSRLETANDPKAQADARLTAIAGLSAADAAPLEATRVKLEAQAAKDLAVAAARQDAADKKRKRSQGVHVGMTKADVLASSWGKPQEINTSTYSFGVHEQWVYGGRNYLYFKDGILTSIQN